MSEATRTPDVSFGSPASSDAPDKNGYVAVTKSEYVTHHALNTVIPSCKVNQVKSYVGGSVEDRTKIYKESIEQNDTFWSHIARRDFYWHRYWPDDKHVKSYNFHRSRGPVHVQWFEGSQTNVCYNAIDRHLPQHKDRVCLYFEGNFVHQTRKITYGEMHAEVVQLANVLRTQYGVKRGDRVSMYLPMIPCAATVMLACARIGAVVSVIFAGFSSQALVSRLIDAKPSLLITADVSFRGDKPILLKSIADVALLECASKGLDLPCLVYSNGEEKHQCSMTAPRDVWYSDAVAQLTAEQRTDCPVEWMDAEDPLFILYTSGSTGTPKALVHTTAGYMVYAATTFKYTFDYHLDDVYFCTADVGWITGHSYVVYGPMINCATSVLYEGVPTFPTPSRWWTLVEKYAVSIFYTAPTAIRTLMKYGDEAVQKCDRRSLRILGSVGEPINVEAWMWLYEVVGERHVDVVDTFWQTETGGHMITPLPGCTPLKPGSASLPFFGVVPVLLDPVTLREIEGEGEGLLSISQPWPGIARTLYEQHDRFEQVYFSADGYYTTGDGARRDADGFIWITGRVDDVLNVSGHRISTSEIEDAVNSHHAVVESAAVGIPHDVKGESIYVYVVFHDGTEITRELLQQIKTTVRHVIGPLATPDHVQPAQSGLPKTRSGKIMRRVLRKIATRKDDEIGDTSTLADGHVVKALIEERKKWLAA